MLVNNFVSEISLKTGTRCGKITDLSSRQRGFYKITNLQLSKEHFNQKEKSVAGPRWVPDTKTTGRLTVGRNPTLTMNFIPLGSILLRMYYKYITQVY
jgi:hypothetical protein